MFKEKILKILESGRSIELKAYQQLVFLVHE